MSPYRQPNFTDPTEKPLPYSVWEGYLEFYPTKVTKLRIVKRKDQDGVLINVVEYADTKDGMDMPIWHPVSKNAIIMEAALLTIIKQCCHYK